LVWTGCPVCRGLADQFGVDQVISLPWTECPVWSGKRKHRARFGNWPPLGPGQTPLESAKHLLKTMGGSPAHEPWIGNTKYRHK